MGKRMKAYFMVPGRTAGFYEMRDAPMPEAKGPMVVVKVHACGVNRGELLALPGYLTSDPDLRAIPSGAEFAGEIVAVGPDATGWHVGERVMARMFGSYAEYVAAIGSNLMRIPEGLSYVEAAAIPNVFVTAYDALATNGRLRQGETVLITAASSGIGTAAIQLAHFLGASKVIATTRSPAKADDLRVVGADLVLDTRAAGWVDELLRATDDRGVDVIVDSVGGPMLADNIRAIAVQGRLISVGRNGGHHGECNMELLAYKRASLIGVTFRTRSPQESFHCNERFMKACLKAFGTGELKPVLDRAFPFEQLGEAHRYMLDDTQTGKIVVTTLADEAAPK